MFNNIISTENLLDAWREFLKGKRGKRDVQEFQYRLSDNILALHDALRRKTYQHGPYHAFNIADPKPRNIHKASVRDRLLHHAIYRILYPVFDRHFIFDSYSCRKGRGTHRAIERFREFALKCSKNNTKTLWILKCDIRKCFASIDQGILIGVVKKHIADDDVVDLIKAVTGSFESHSAGKGLPLGNLTSQVLVNVYMNQFDQFVKHELKAKYYIRYADDFVVMSRDCKWLQEILNSIRRFLRDALALELHGDKVSICTLASGVDFLGWIHFPDHRVLRTATKRRMLARLNSSPNRRNTLPAYLGMLRYGNTRKLRSRIEANGEAPNAKPPSSADCHGIDK